MKRFYSAVDTHRTDDGFQILLDGKPLNLTGGSAFIVPTQQLADLIASEWAAQGERINHADMVVTALAQTALLRPNAVHHADWLDTDLVLFFSETPPEIHARQKEIWLPFIQSFNTRYSVHLAPVTALTLPPQDTAFKEKIQNIISNYSPWVMTGLESLMEDTGSLILALSLVNKESTAENLYKAIFIEEDYQEQVSGISEDNRDPITEKKRTRLKHSLLKTEAYLETLEK